ncbi:MAG: cytochrome b N-terminal domain-containing protein, partial [Mariprofundaceae bacterium]
TFIKGGGSIGAQTLSRFFAMHIWILPSVLFMAVALHLYLFRKQGVAGPFSGDAPSLEQKKAFFFPRQFFIDVLFALLLYLILVVLAVYFAPVLRSPANPAVSPAHVAPEWYFLFLYELLKYFPQDLIVVGTVVIPGFMAALLVALPFYNRNPERHPRKRWLAITFYFTGLVFIVTLTVMAIRSAPETLHKDPAMVAEGKRIYDKSNCEACHLIHGAGGDMGPDLSYEGLSGRSPDWIRGHFRNPGAFAKGSTMPTAEQLGLSEADIEALTHYMFSLE